MGFRMTRHAEERLAQRGIRREALDIVLAYADVERRAPGGAVQLRVTRQALVEASRDGVARTVIERAVDVAAIICEGRVLTQYRCTGRRRRSGARRGLRRRGRS